MHAWTAADSLPAPLIVGCAPDRIDEEWALRAFDSACLALPDVAAHLTTGNFKGKTNPAVLTTLSVDGPGDTSRRRVRWALRADGEDLAVAGKRWWWEVSLNVLADGSAAPAVPADRLAVMCEVTRFSVLRGRMRGAQQLALLRYLWIDMLRSRDPEAVVIGGRHDWNRTWWQPATPGDVPSPRASS